MSSRSCPRIAPRPSCRRASGAIRLKDPESGRAMSVGLNSRSRQAYAEAVARRRAAVVDGCYRASIDYVFVSTDGPVMEPLLELFARRKIA